MGSADASSASDHAHTVSELAVGDSHESIVLERGAAGYCEMCGMRLASEPSFSVLAASATPTGWLATGRVDSSGVPWEPGRCPRCGAVGGFILEGIPIELAEYACPTCGSGDLRFRVLRVELLADGSYGFAVAADCASCQHQSWLRRVLGALRGITKISVGPAGIEIERSATDR